jgi:hypothetical protein
MSFFDPRHMRRLAVAAALAACVALPAAHGVPAAVASGATDQPVAQSTGGHGVPDQECPPGCIQP